jgi:hypothetical protein
MKSQNLADEQSGYNYHFHVNSWLTLLTKHHRKVKLNKRIRKYVETKNQTCPYSLRKRKIVLRQGAILSQYHLQIVEYTKNQVEDRLNLYQHKL